MHRHPPAPLLATLPNGLRMLALPMPGRRTVALSVFVRTGSLHEPARWSGISHVVEHMAFKGTTTRDCQRINLDAERLGAEVNAHTDRDHTAFHIEGLGRDLVTFVPMLADIVLNGTFPEDELARERQVILHELTEVEEDPAAMAFQAFDRACYGQAHAAGRPVIGRRERIERLTRADLLAYVQRQYTAANVVVAAAGAVDDPGAFFAAVTAAFGHMPAGTPHSVAPPTWQGGVLQRRLAGSSMCHVVLGFEAPPLTDPAHAAHVVAAAVLGEGMSSPLLDEVRERRGLAYYVGCSADVLPFTGQFVVEAATAPDQAADLFTEVHRLLHALAEHGPQAVDLERSRNQLALRLLRAQEQPARWMEGAVQDLFTHGRLRAPDDVLRALQAVDAPAVQAVFARAVAGRAAVALAGCVTQRARQRAVACFGA